MFAGGLGRRFSPLTRSKSPCHVCGTDDGVLWIELFPYSHGERPSDSIVKFTGVSSFQIEFDELYGPLRVGRLVVLD